jgi:hypothetical protein
MWGQMRTKSKREHRQLASFGATCTACGPGDGDISVCLDTLVGLLTPPSLSPSHPPPSLPPLLTPPTLLCSSQVSPGVVLSYGCVVGPRATVPPLSHLSLCQPLASAVSLSDDELEYAAAGGASGGGRRRRGPVRRRGSGLKQQVGGAA